MERMKIKNIFTPSDGIFRAMTEAGVYLPWNDLLNDTQLDLLYLTHSGEKTLSSIVDFTSEDAFLRKIEIALAVYELFKEKWSNLWKVENQNYNPLENYRMVEEVNVTHGHIVDYTGTDKNDGNQHTKIYGFNSIDGRDSGDVDASNTETRNMKDAHSGTDTTHTTRSGNIGVTTSQQMAESTYDLYDKWNIWKVVFSDIDSILTIPIY
ncbi:MAG: hypothetical protein MJZ34_14635 [Paludibacteraceae bacterium]|nr:hypothetical protein [Paludibacteraceae bacterium]